MGYAPVTAVSQKKNESVQIGVNRKMIACKPAQPDGAAAHPMRNFAEPLKRMLGKAEITEILSVCSIAVRETGTVYADGAKRIAGN